MKLLVGAMGVLYFCYGCATSAAVQDQQKSGAKHVQKPQTPSSPPPAAAVTKPADRILGVQIQDHGGVLAVLISGNRPFQDYVYQRLTSDSFILGLAGINTPGTCPGLPVRSHGLHLRYVAGKAGNGAHIIGTLRHGVGRYHLKSVGNDLILTLYRPGQKVSGTIAGASRKTLRTPPPAPATPQLGRPAGVPMTARESIRQHPRHVRIDSERRYGPGMGLKKNYTGKPISLDLQEADLKNVLRLLADLSGTNMVIEPDVSGKVTLKVNNVPWDQVLHLVLSMNNLGEEKVGNVIRIATQAKLRQEWKDQEQALQARQKLLELSQNVGPITTAYLTVNYAQPTDVAAKIKEIESPKGKISVDNRTSLIIYSDYPSRVAEARGLLARLDKPSPQVMIEARIVTLNSDSTLDLGVQWNFSSGVGTNSSFNQTFAVNHLNTARDTYNFGLSGFINNTMWNLDMTLSALEAASQAKVVAAPKVLTLDNQKADISQGTKIPYLELTGENVSSTTFQNATVELQVTPHITPDHKVRLQINAKEDEPGTTYNNQTSIDTRQIKTELLVDNGKIVVIGGVIRRNDSTSTSGVPGFDKIPLLGRLFKQDEYKRNKTELLIFISPKIVPGSL